MNTEVLKNIERQGVDPSILFFTGINLILVPKKAEYNLRRYVSKPLLRKIDKDLDIAIEKCLIFLSNLSSTYYTEDKWKTLSSTVLHEQLKRGNDNTYIYKSVLEALISGTNKGSIITVDDSYSINNYSKGYRLTDSYLKAGLTEYVIQDEHMIQRRSRRFHKQLNIIQDNVIGNNLLRLYSNIYLPTVKEVKAQGRRLTKLGYKTKKGKILTMRNKHTDEYWNDVSNRSFVEDSIDLFEFLTKRGFMIPNIGSEKSGGRVVDSFTLMPSWIRDMVRIDDISIVEADYSALHPNISKKLYNGSESSISHQEVANYLNIGVKEAKIEHLSFFNKRITSMKKSPLYKYYYDNEYNMLTNIIEDKSTNGYKKTSRRLFKTEVNVMTEVIKRLNEQNIYVGYVYDALFTTDEHLDIVTKTMNEVIVEFGINTVAK